MAKMLQSGKTEFAVPALRTLGNIVSGNDVQTQAVLDSNIIPLLVPLLKHPKKNIRKESCWMLSNIAAGTEDQISHLLAFPDVLSQVLVQMSTASEWDVRKEALWVISNIATGGKHKHITCLIEHGAISPLCDLLMVGDVRLLSLAMDSIEALFKTMKNQSNDIEKLVKLIDEAGGIDKLENLQEHENEEIYQKSIRILETYFGGEDAPTDSENLMPSSNQSTFSFGIPNNPKATGMFPNNGKPFEFGTTNTATNQHVFFNSF
jgi:hypothetical protein